MPAVFVFGQAGCPACEEYLPRFKQLASGSPFPVGVYDLAKDRKANDFATRMGVSATPTTVVMDRHGRLHKTVGAVTDSAIRALLKRVLG